MPAASPKNELLPPVVVERPALKPKNWFDDPVVLFWPALMPTNELALPVVLARPELPASTRVGRAGGAAERVRVGSERLARTQRVEGGLRRLLHRDLEEPIGAGKPGRRVIERDREQPARHLHRAHHDRRPLRRPRADGGGVVERELEIEE